MVTKEKWRVDGFRRMSRGKVVMVVRMPMSFRHGSGRLGEVRCLDGKAIVFPATGGVLVCCWYKFMRFVRRHKMA